MSPDPPDSAGDAGSQKTEDQARDVSAPKQLTEAEQMALFEEELKESDWGHQPC